MLRVVASVKEREMGHMKGNNNLCTIFFFVFFFNEHIITCFNERVITWLIKNKYFKNSNKIALYITFYQLR